MISVVHCTGWWEQDWYGRQPMHQLRLLFLEDQFEGSGTDIVGPFTMAGTIAADGTVRMVKQYLGQHSVEYVGTYDGEGVLSGTWHVSYLRGPWMIRLGRAEADAEALTVGAADEG